MEGTTQVEGFCCNDVELVSNCVMDVVPRRPPGNVLANYWRCLPRDSLHSRHVKTIVSTAHAISPVE